MSGSSWKWMSHPSRRNGEVIPVKVWHDDEFGMVYLPFDADDRNFLIWDKRSPEWVECPEPPCESLDDWSVSWPFSFPAFILFSLLWSYQK